MRFLKVYLLLSCFCLTTISTAQVDSLSLAKKKSTVVLPLVFYTPETRLGFGAAAISTFRFKNTQVNDRPSQIQLGVAYTLKRQLLSYSSFQLFTPNQSYFLFGELGYYRYVYPYFGVSNHTKTEEEESYSVNYPRLRINALKRIDNNWYLGLRYWWDDYRISKRKSEGLLSQDQVAGSDGSTISTLGAVAIFDSRDFLFYPSKGWYFETALSISESWLGASHHYQRWVMDITKYLSLGSDKHILAINGWVDFTFGDVPFQQLAFIGGPKKMRGYIEGRYRDEKLMILQLEYRFPLFWRLKGAIFTGTGQVAPQLNEFSIEQFHTSFGTGLRIQIDKKNKVHIRIDAGFDEKGNFLPYLTFNEAF